jgi:serine/threonine protein phosphatase PrpC
MMLPNSTWRILGASVTGTSHQKIGRGCDDAHAYHQQENGSLFVAVADGAGSATHSAKGARKAVEVALNRAQDILAQQIKPEGEDQWYVALNAILKAVRTALEELASDRSELPDRFPLREFATTLLLVIVTSQEIAVVQIGDGVVVIQHADGTLQSITQPEHGEYINETSFVTDSDYLNQAQYIVLPQKEIRGLAMLTDGLEMLALDFATKTPYNPFFAPLFRLAARPDTTEKELVNILESERVCVRTDDDKTLVLAVHI